MAVQGTDTELSAAKVIRRYQGGHVFEPTFNTNLQPGEGTVSGEQCNLEKVSPDSKDLRI